ncbi:hypothetical protein BH09ACT8_BH09ACT8_50130 [soil metagenome]
MLGHRIGALTATWALALPAIVLGIAVADGEVKGCPAAAIDDDGACFGRLIPVTAKDFTITGTSVGGHSPIALSGQTQAHLPSTGFVGTSSDPVQQSDAAIDRVVNSSDPNWYGNGKARAFLPVELNQRATQFPPDTGMVRFVPDEANPGGFRLVVRPAHWRIAPKGTLRV